MAKQEKGSGKIGINGILKVARLFVRAVLGLVLLYRRLRYGYAFRRIRFSGPRYAKVDPEDYERLAAYEWFCIKSRRCFYAVRAGRSRGSGWSGFVFMHREVVEVGEGMLVDHANREGVDNRKANLREATHAQNACNRRKRPGGTSKYKGVSFRKATGKWTARICINRKGIHLGCFENEIDAAKAYDNAARKHHGEFAALNFPERVARPPRLLTGEKAKNLLAPFSALRVAGHAENGSNKPMPRAVGKSKYKGVTFRKDRKKWLARIVVAGRVIYLGCFEDEIGAAKAYDNAARKYRSGFPRLNFPD